MSTWGPAISLRWGPYGRPDAADEKSTVDTTAAAFSARLITRRTAVEKVAAMFGIENVAEYVEKLEAEDEEREDEAAEQLLRAAGLSHKAAAKKAGSKDDERVAADQAEHDAGDTGDDAEG